MASPASLADILGLEHNILGSVRACSHQFRQRNARAQIVEPFLWNSGWCTATARSVWASESGSNLRKGRELLGQSRVRTRFESNLTPCVQTASWRLAISFSCINPRIASAMRHSCQFVSHLFCTNSLALQGTVVLAKTLPPGCCWVTQEIYCAAQKRTLFSEGLNI